MASRQEIREQVFQDQFGQCFSCRGGLSFEQMTFSRIDLKKPGDQSNLIGLCNYCAGNYRKDNGRRKIFDRQSGQCFACQRILVFSPKKDPRQPLQRMVFTKIDLKKNRSPSNLVGLCAYCNGGRSNVETLNDLLIWRKNNPLEKNIIIKDDLYHRNVATFKDLLKDKLQTDDLVISRFVPPTNIRDLSDKRIVEIVEIIHTKFQNGEVKLKWDHVPRTPKFNLPMIIQYVSDRNGLRLFLGGCQGHRCCYCQEELIYISSPERLSKDHWRAATLEHVIELCNDGPNNFENLVVVCSRCNNLRGLTHLSAEDFFHKIQEGGISSLYREYDEDLKFWKQFRARRKVEKACAREQQNWYDSFTSSAIEMTI